MSASAWFGGHGCRGQRGSGSPDLGKYGLNQSAPFGVTCRRTDARWEISRQHGQFVVAFPLLQPASLSSPVIAPGHTLWARAPLSCAMSSPISTTTPSFMSCFRYCAWSLVASDLVCYSESLQVEPSCLAAAATSSIGSGAPCSRRRSCGNALHSQLPRQVTSNPAVRRTSSGTPSACSAPTVTPVSSLHALASATKTASNPDTSGMWPPPRAPTRTRALPC